MSSEHHVNIFFESKALDHDTFAVVRFEGEEEISRPYRFVVDLVSDRPDVDLDAALGRPATLSFQRGDDGELRKIHGVLSEIELGREGQHGHYAYRAVLVPRLWMMSLTRQNQIYQNRTIPEIVEEELKGSKGKGPAGNSTFDFAADDFEFRLLGSYPQKEYLVQYAESDLDFISRLLEHVGIYYFFEQGEDRERIVFCDSNVHLPSVPEESSFPYVLPSGTSSSLAESVQFLASRRRQITDKVLLKDYNYRTPMTPLQAEKPVEGAGYGMVCHYGDHFKTPEEGQALAQVRAEEVLCGKALYRGEGDCHGFTAGHLFQLTEHFSDALNQEYLLTAVRHVGSQASSEATGFGEGEGGEATSYRNEFRAVPKTVAYRPVRRTAKPKLTGVMNAVIDASGPGTRAEIDGEGRYKLVMPFDVSGTAEGKATRWVRMAQPYGGGQHGMHFPLLKGTEVLWTCIGGDPDRPVISGVVPNPLNKSVVNSESHTKNRIQTPSGILIEMEDGPGGPGQALSGNQQQGQGLAPAVRLARTEPTATAAERPAPTTALTSQQQGQESLGFVSESEADPIIGAGLGRYLRMHVPQAYLDPTKNNPPQTIVTQDPKFRYEGEDPATDDPNDTGPARPGDQPLPNDKIEAYLRMGANLPRSDGSKVKEGEDSAWLPLHKEPGDELYGVPGLERSETDAVSGGQIKVSTQERQEGHFTGFIDNVSEGNDENEGNPSRTNEASKAKFRNGVVWRDHVAGNRLSTTQGDKVEIVSGNYRQILCNSAVSVDAVNGTLRDGSNVPGNVSFKWTETGPLDKEGAEGYRDADTWGTTEITRNGWTKTDYQGYEEEIFKGHAEESFEGTQNSCFDGTSNESFCGSRHSKSCWLETDLFFGVKLAAEYGATGQYRGGLDVDYHDSLTLEADNDWKYTWGSEGYFKFSGGRSYEVIEEQDLIAKSSIMLQVNGSAHSALGQWWRGVIGGAGLVRLLPLFGLLAGGSSSLNVSSDSKAGSILDGVKNWLERKVDTDTAEGKPTIEIKEDFIVLSIGTSEIRLTENEITIKSTRIRLNPPAVTAAPTVPAPPAGPLPPAPPVP
ncbi:MAG: type VI secretion system tip protein TssI/VgrG [Kiloniellales bacterium]|nr:type VI secretion system tip protein TssI/VgrG [Kiloniellales bacterium]